MKLDGPHTTIAVAVFIHVVSDIKPLTLYSGKKKYPKTLTARS